MMIPRFILFPLALLAASCASDSGDTSPAPDSHKPLSQRLSESNGYKQDASGNWLPKIDKRSSFEAQGESAYFKGDYSGKTYKTGEYSKKSWWGNKDYGRQAYGGTTDGSRFQKSSSLAGTKAPETGNTAKIPDPYRTNNFATSAARESGTNRLGKPANDSSRKIYPQPDIIDWQEQRSMTLDQSKGILGR